MKEGNFKYFHQHWNEIEFKKKTKLRNILLFFFLTELVILILELTN